jgi:tetratricopeptide (TPR) repeat protein
MKFIKIIILLLLFPLLLGAQESKLAQQYFLSGEYEKASVLYEKLYNKGNSNTDYYFNRYIDCLIALEEYKKCETIIKQELKKNPQEVQLYVTYGNLFEKQFKDAEAKEQYRKAIKKMPPDRYIITQLANAFTSLTKYDMSIEAYEKGAQLLKDPTIFSYNLGDLYRRKGDTEKMIEHYLNSLSANPGRLNSMKTIFQRFLNQDYEELQIQLYSRIQDEPDIIQYPELLSWVFVQKKDYKNALRQARALDRKLDENGGRVFRLGGIAANDGDYDAAIEAYDYVVSEKGLSSSFYIEAQRESLSCKRKKIIKGFNYKVEDLRELENQYETFLDEFGKNKTTATIIAELADLEAFYLNDLDKAIALLNEMINYPGLNKKVQATSKLSLADFYLMKGEIWESTLLYSQVDKAFKDDILGHEARLRNAKLSYYAGDFQWAQAQFDVLKASTSKLISNDALDLSVFILDNMGLDTSMAALQLYAEADLLVFQNRPDEAFLKLDTLNLKFPGHTLEDDILYLKSKIYLKQNEYEKSAEMLQEITENFADGIRADNALYELAELYENQLNDLEKAKELYEKIFIEYSGSTFAVDARKRFRILRGDNMQ